LGLAVFVLAAALRLPLYDTARFTGDEARDYEIGCLAAGGHGTPLLGPPLTGGRARMPGPLYYWFVAAPCLLSRMPEVGNVCFELLAAAIVWMFWLALRRPFGDAGATFAAVLMALSPWNALYGDKVTNIPPFLFLEGAALLAACRLRERPETVWAVVVLPVACLALPQLHMSAPGVWLALVPMVWGGIRRWNRRALAVGLALGALLYVPFFLSEARTGLGNTHAFIAESLASRQSRGATNLTFLLTPVYALRFLTLDTTYHELTGYWGGLDERAAWHALWYGSEARPFHPLRVAALLASGLLVLVAAATAVREAIARARAGGARAALGPFGWCAIFAVVGTLLLLGVTRKQIFPHYVALALPFVFVLFAPLGRAAFGAAGPAGAMTRPARALALALAMIFCLGGIEATLSISRRVDGRNGLAVHRAVFDRFFADCAAAGRSPERQPIHLDASFMWVAFSYPIYAQYALGRRLPWGNTSGAFAYLLRKPGDPAPAAAGSFPVSRLGFADLYRLR
jgi:hypothetical protein